MQGWKFNESKHPTRQINTKRNKIQCSNIDIIITKNLQRNKYEVKYAEFDKILSDHKVITVTIKNLDHIADEITKSERIDKQYDYGTSRKLWTKLAQAELPYERIH